MAFGGGALFWLGNILLLGTRSRPRLRAVYAVLDGFVGGLLFGAAAWWRASPFTQRTLMLVSLGLLALGFAHALMVLWALREAKPKATPMRLFPMWDPDDES